jgi:glycosyltransferase involved in cell wall biosynthesis
MYQGTEMWDKFCRMISTYDDRGPIQKIWAAAKAYFISPLAVARAEIVHIHLAGQISLLRKLPIVALASLLRRRLIIHVHASGEDSLFDDTPRWAWKFVLETADYVIALSPSWKKIILKHAEGARVVVLPNPVNTFAPINRNISPSPRVLYVGKLESRKGFKELITAAAFVLQEFPQVEFWFAGHGDLDTARQHALHLGISEQIHLLGWLNAGELTAIYDQADIFCLPSHNEGVPMSVLEAMSHGLPVVCTPVGGLPDIVRDGKNALYAKPGDPGSIANALLHLLREPDMAATLAKAGQNTVIDNFHIQQIIERLEELYWELAATESASPSKVLHDA